ncbi:DUF6299 family protein [Streptomyces huasconensis]|uniref:DUF6299 family protein n=1 Tax=Streptomyces huasconensis TaxID=1854574 RepID=UPI0033F0FA19
MRHDIAGTRTVYDGALHCWLNTGRKLERTPPAGPTPVHASLRDLTTTSGLPLLPRSHAVQQQNVMSSRPDDRARGDEPAAPQADE